MKALTVDSREALLIRHMTSLCKDLGAVAIAEMIEIRDTAHVLKALGVTLGQGWTFGKPEAQPKWTPPSPPAFSIRSTPPLHPRTGKKKPPRRRPAPPNGSALRGSCGPVHSCGAAPTEASRFNLQS